MRYFIYFTLLHYFTLLGLSDKPLHVHCTLYLDSALSLLQLRAKVQGLFGFWSIVHPLTSISIIIVIIISIVLLLRGFRF